MNPTGARSSAVPPEGARRDDLLGELVLLLDRRTVTDGRTETAVPALNLYRFSHPTEPAYVLQEPAVYIVVQGRKEVAIGGERYVYDRARYLAVSVGLPVLAHVSEASPDRPYLCMTLTVDPRELAALVVETGRRPPRGDHDGRALFLAPLGAPLLDALARLVRLLDVPEDVPVLAPLVLRELNYRLLQDDRPGRLAEMAIGDGRLRRVSGAIAWLRDHYAEPMEVADLARRSNMSPSSLHHEFKAVTALSPLQYQKRLRLQEARRLLASGTTSAEGTAYEVGYASASQFSREYARLFGEPPRRDAERIREGLVDAAPVA
jgi:AraC-like DNA-binding protein